MSDASFKSACASDESWEKAAGAILRQIGEMDGRFRLGILYVTPPFANDLHDIEIFFRQTTGVPHWIGTIGIGVIGTGQEIMDEPALSVMVLPLEEEVFRVFDGVQDETDAISRDHADWLGETVLPLILAHGDAGNQLIPGLLRDLSEETDSHIVGGIACASGHGAQLADGLAGGGLSGVMFAPERIPVQTALTQGCQPIGPVHTITRAEGPVILELDNRPALDVFRQVIGPDLNRHPERIPGAIFAALPAPGQANSATSLERDYLIRPLTGIDEGHKAFAINQPVLESDPLVFCRRDRAGAIADMRQMLADLKRRIGGRSVRGGIYISCAARGPNQFKAPEREVDLIKDYFGDIPLVGFFANGEISRDQVYGFTGVLTLFF